MSTPAEKPVVVASSNAAIVGRFTVEVNPTAERAEDRMRITHYSLVDRHQQLGDEIATIGQSASSVLTSATLTNNTTAAWDPTGTTLRVQVKIANDDTANHWDEPYLVITSITPKGSSNCTDAASCPVVFSAHPTQAAGKTFSADAPSSYTGSGATFGTYYLADIEKSATGKTNRALQWLNVTDASAVTFNFTADVWATPTTATVYPDTDGDTWNREAYSEGAGGDCQESTTGSSYTSPYAACGVAGCATNCNDGSCAGASTTSSSTTNCCDDTSSGFTNLNCKQTLAGAPACHCSGRFSGAGNVSCQPGSTCYATADSTKSHVETITCYAGSTCMLDCSARSSPSGVNCAINNCNAAGASCTIICPTGDSPVRCTNRNPDPAGSIYRCGAC